jgi:hypothetical protein
MCQNIYVYSDLFACGDHLSKTGVSVGNNSTGYNHFVQNFLQEKRGVYNTSFNTHTDNYAIIRN